MEKKRASPLSAASEAFQTCSADLIRGIHNPELLAWELYSDDVIPQKVMDEVSVVGLSTVQRKTRLLSAVRDQIAVDPVKFQKLLQVLRKQPPLKGLSDSSLVSSVIMSQTIVLHHVHNVLVLLLVNPAKFQNLLRTLRGQLSLNDVAEKLKTTYESQLEVVGRETELKGVSHCKS